MRLIKFQDRTKVSQSQAISAVDSQSDRQAQAERTRPDIGFLPLAVLSAAHRLLFFHHPMAGWPPLWRTVTLPVFYLPSPFSLCHQSLHSSALCSKRIVLVPDQPCLNVISLPPSHPLPAFNLHSAVFFGLRA